MNGDGANGLGAEPKRLGTLIGGSLTKGLEVRLDGDVSVEEMAVGRFITVLGEHQRFFAIIDDVELKAAHPAVTATPLTNDPFIRQAMSGTATFATLHVVPYLTVGLGEEVAQPAKTVPAHFAAVCEASQADVALIFGTDGPSHFVIGSPLDMDVKVCLNYERFIERSNGVFGKSGTGKTFLTRLLLLSIMQKSNAQANPDKRAVHLVFDMHDEYGWKGTSETGSGEVKGLKQIFPSSIAVYTLDERSSQQRQVSYDATVEIGYEDVEPEDIEILRDTLNLTEAAIDVVYALHRRFKAQWLRKLMVEDDEAAIDSLIDSQEVHPQALAKLRRSLNRLVRLPFLREQSSWGFLKSMLSNLLGGKSVVIEFGRYSRDLAAYILVANMITRRIADEYRSCMERYLGGSGSRPNHLVITIEEAHKFLGAEVAGKTIFGEIAREMRKFNATLLVIDQRPSGIDQEVMSQIGTKIAFLLDDEDDINRVLSGVSGRGEMRAVLAKLDSRQQALIFGHAVPMPVVVRPEEWGPQTYARFSQGSLAQRLGSRPADDLFPPQR